MGPGIEELGIPMMPKCLDSNCQSQNQDPGVSPGISQVIRNGSYYRSSDGQHIRRYHCRSCRRSFSASSRNVCFGQKKRQINHPIKKLLVSGVSQRRAAALLGVNRKTVVRKFRFLANAARLSHEKWLEEQSKTPMSEVQFDDLETSEHSKCKPLSVALAVQEKTRKILGFQVSQMPAKGPLAEIAFKKYGPRPDLRAVGWQALFKSLTSVVTPTARFRSDQNPQYPKHLKDHFPDAVHETVKGRRGCVAGQGELKKIGFDPIFDLNHTCAMLRANLNRLFRRTWCTTKTKQGLLDHLALYVQFHNEVLTSGPTG